MMKYGDLDLKRLREECGLDFAHYTYLRNQCSCCYGPRDLPAKYWHNHIIKPEGEEIQYILFKNANNGSGAVSAGDTICIPSKSQRKWGVLSSHVRVYILWNFPEEKMDKVLACLRRQLDEDYHIVRPKDSWECITICLKEDMYECRNGNPEDIVPLWDREFRLDPYQPPEVKAKTFLEQNVFTIEVEHGNSYIIVAKDIVDAQQKAKEFLGDYDFTIDHISETGTKGVYC